MPITTPTFDYAFDPHGQLVANRITGEQHVITTTQHRNYRKVVPRWAPFFANSLKVRYVSPLGVARELKLGEDYYLGHQFLSASRACAQPIYGSINIIDQQLQGTVVIDQYQTIGGMWTLDVQEIAGILADQLYNPRIISWEAVTQQPANFPVVDHEWDIVDMKGMSDLVAAIQGIRDAVFDASDSGLITHMADLNNPHGVTKAQTGLGLVENYGIATKTVAEAGTANNAYMTPLRTKEAIQTQVLTTVQTHLANLNNPHGVTAGQIGAPTLAQMDAALALKLNANAAAVDSVLFNGMTLAQVTTQVLTGTAANSIRFSGMTFAEATAQILLGTAANADKFANMTLTQFDAHIKDVVLTMSLNAVNSTRFDGRSFAEAKDEILQGTAANSTKFADMDLTQFNQYMTSFVNAMSLYAVDSAKLEGRTFAQVRDQILLGTAANSTKFADMDLTQFSQFITTLVQDMSINAADSAKFANRTFAQAKDEILQGTAANSTKFADMTLTQFNTHIDTLVKAMSLTAANSLLFAGKTLPEVMAETLQGTANNSDRFAGMDLDQFELYLNNYIANLDNLEVTAIDTERFDGKTYEQAKADILSGTAGNAEMFNGMTPQQYDTHIAQVFNNIAMYPGTAGNSLLLGGYTAEQIIQNAAAMDSENALKLDGRTRTELTTEILAGKAADAGMFDGMTTEDYSDYVFEDITIGNAQIYNFHTTHRGTDSVKQYVHLGTLKMPTSATTTAAEASTRVPSRLRVVAERIPNQATGISERGDYEFVAMADRVYSIANASAACIDPVFKWVKGDINDPTQTLTDEDGNSWVEVRIYGLIQAASVGISSTIYGGLVKEFEQLPTLAQSSLPTGAVNCTVLKSIYEPEPETRPWLEKTVYSGTMASKTDIKTHTLTDPANRVFQVLARYTGDTDWHTAEAAISVKVTATAIVLNSELDVSVDYRLIVI